MPIDLVVNTDVWYKTVWFILKTREVIATRREDIVVEVSECVPRQSGEARQPRRDVGGATD